jgi:copper(I)-binding protein
LTAAAGLVAALALAGCGSSDSSGSSASGTEVTVTGQWARTSPMAADAGAAYLTITSPVADQLVGVSVDPSIAGEAQLHETTMVAASDMTDDTAMTDDTMSDMTDDTMSGMTDDTAMSGEVMQMRQVSAIDLPAGTAVSLAPGGYHIMLLGLVSPLEVGQSFDVTLTFATGPDLVVSVPVLDEAPAS